MDSNATPAAAVDDESSSSGEVEVNKFVMIWKQKWMIQKNLPIEAKLKKWKLFSLPGHYRLLYQEIF